MRTNLLLVLLASASVGACAYKPGDDPARGLSAVNEPVVARSDYVFDAAAPGGSLPVSEAARLEAWFRGLDLGYGDTISVDGPYADAARADVARIAGQFGMLVTSGAPVTAGIIPEGSVRVVVSRTRADVPGCPNWSDPALPNYNNRTMSNYGCSVNGNLAAMVANPNDLIHGREGSGVTDAATASRAVQSYRTQRPTGEQGLQDIQTKKEGK
ncbi:CpaD family pilus assembly protein [Sphingomonas arenae]|uniref:CpaD family pilus assembly protein n=1 Tax=Sphingomonas arenae TaxID=2812555 RepID=UPI00196789C5|nr:CpaD family pilus assembly lipoprotein [Sphingomonas arenae]